jgi:antirestriction protein ArdC
MATKKSWSKKSTPKRDPKEIYREVTQMIVDTLSEGTVPWSKGRSDAIGAIAPTNFNTGVRYKGINALNLMLTGKMLGNNSNYFITYNQALNVAGVTKKDPDLYTKSPLTGEKSVGRVVYWGNTTKDENGKPWYVIENGKKRTQPTQKEIKDENLNQIWFLRDTAVFSFEQMDLEKIPKEWIEKRNMNPKEINVDVQNDKELSNKLFKIAEMLDVKVVHDPAFKSAAYSSAEIIKLPPREMYENDARYLHSFAHELVHATGSPRQLDRESLRNAHNDDKSLAYEELVAELGGVFLSVELGIHPLTHDTLANHASYIEGWHSLLADDLKGDCKILNQACQEAEKAVALLTKNLDRELALDTIKATKAKPKYEEAELGM